MKDYDATLMEALRVSTVNNDICTMSIMDNEKHIQKLVTILDKLDSFVKAPCVLDAIYAEMRGRRYQIELNMRAMRDQLANNYENGAMTDESYAAWTKWLDIVQRDYLHVDRKKCRFQHGDRCLVADATGVVKATIVGLPDEFDETTYVVKYDSNHTKSNDVIVIEERIEDRNLFRETEMEEALAMAQNLNAVELNISECAERAAQNNRFFYQGRQRALQKQQETLNKSEKQQ